MGVRMRKRNKLLYGVGVNDSTYQVRRHINGKTVFFCSVYKVWTNMLKRVYCEKYHKTSPAYKNTTVCADWLLFSNFKKWMLGRDWEGKELDKDILVIGNKEYAPDKCCFVDRATNSLLLDNKSRKGKYPTGVEYLKRDKKFRARCNVLGVSVTIGYYDNPESAEKEYRIFKASVIAEAALRIEDISIRSGLLRHANLLHRTL